MTQCSVCLSVDGFGCEGRDFNGGLRREECQVCGFFVVTREAVEDFLGSDRKKTTRVVRAALSHWIRQRQVTKNSDDLVRLTSDIVEAALAKKIALPNPSQQATNIIRYVGDYVDDAGGPIDMLRPDFSASVGSPSRSFALDLAYELKNRGLLSGYERPDLNSPGNMQEVSLTLSGWEIFEAERKGQTSGNYGFIALETGDAALEPLIRDHVKPSLSSLGYDLVDYRDISKAGIIDNILRVQIRDAAFVLVDLTHDNRGAYWEAGYAEGLGKPVLYICEKSKFEEASTHFDTNHCTTVQWDANNIPEFIANLTATLKRSLNI
jgi:hypothetical protein